MRTPVVVVSSVALVTWMLAAGCGGGDGSATTEGNTTSTGAGGSGQGGGNTSTGTAGGGGEGGGGEGGQGAGTPYVCEVTPTNGVVLAVDQIFLGETNPDGSESADAWRQYGFNLDGLVSTSSSVDVCQPYGGAAPAVHTDGNNGIDNSFGRNIVPILMGLVAAPSAEATAAITSGESTTLIYLEGLEQAPTQTMIPARVYTGARTEEAPAWDGSDCRGVDPASLQDAGDIMAPAVLFPQSLIVNQEWSGGAVSQGPLTVRVMIGGTPLELKIHQLRALFQMPPSHDSAMSGRLGGVLHLDELEASFRALAGAFDPNLCDGATIESIVNLLRQSADILADGSQDPAQVCNAVSIGIGFTMAPVQLGSIAPPEQLTDPCAP